MTQQTGQALFAEISLATPGTIRAKMIGPSLGQREVTIITDMVRAAIDQNGAGLQRLELDLSQIDFMNSTALGMCIDFRNRAHKVGGKTMLIGMKQQLAELFAMVKVDKLFTIVKDGAGS